MNRQVIIVATVLGIAGAGLWWWQTQAPAAVEWQGYAEADFVKVGPVLEGLLVSLHVQRGTVIACGEPLFDQDDIADRAAVEQTRKQLRQAENQLVNLRSGGKPTEILQAEANLAEA